MKAFNKSNQQGSTRNQRSLEINLNQSESECTSFRKPFHFGSFGKGPCETTNSQIKSTCSTALDTETCNCKLQQCCNNLILLLSCMPIQCPKAVQGSLMKKSEILLGNHASFFLTCSCLIASRVQVAAAFQTQTEAFKVLLDWTQPKSQSWMVPTSWVPNKI